MEVCLNLKISSLTNSIFSIKFSFKCETKIGSISTAIIFFTLFDKGYVRAPLPGPISSTVSLLSGSKTEMILSIKFLSLIKF